ncbi:MAG: cytochrome c3 family protein [bacterium]
MKDKITSQQENLIAALVGALIVIFLMCTLPAYAQSTILSAPLISCIDCHKSQGQRFKRLVSHHPNIISSGVQMEYSLFISLSRADCTICHLYDPKSHTKGLKLLIDPDPTDPFIFNAQSPNTNNLCLSCHDTVSEQTRFFSTGDSPPEIASMWMSGAVHNNPPIECKNCHNPHGSVQPSLQIKEEEMICYNCHADMISKFDALASSGHRVEGVDLAGIPTDILNCADCHNPHLITASSSLSNPFSPRSLYLQFPFKLATEALIDPLVPGRILSGNAYYLGNVADAEGVPLANQFCLECHAPLLLVPPRPVWQGAVDISFELLNKYWDPLKTISNFHYNHDHDESRCSTCHESFPSFTRTFTREINGHFTHNDNASCTYCHDPHGSKGSFVGEGIINTLYEGESPGPVIGIQRGHLLPDWILVNSANVEPLPYNDMGYKSLTKNGARSCFINDPLHRCHDVSYRHAPIIKDIEFGPEAMASCNTMTCHSSFTPAVANNNGILIDRIAPAPPY